MFRTAIIGCGGITERRHGPVLSRMTDRVQLVALADLSEERLALMGDKLGVPPERRYTDWEQMLAREELDLVDIATPHGVHAEQAIAAAQAGAHVLIEKPIARTVDEADRMISAAEDAGVRLCVLHNQLFAPATQKTLELIGEGAIGEPFLFRSEGIGGSHVAGRGVGRDWRATAEGGGGGALIDNGYHQLYRARAWMGSPVRRVFARIGTFYQGGGEPPRVEVEDLALVVLEHESGATTSIQVGWCAPGGAVGMEEVFGTQGQMRWSLWSEKQVSVWTKETGEWRDVPVAQEGPDEVGFPPLVDRFLTALQTGGPVPVPGEDSREILAIVEAAYESGRTRQVVEIR